MRGHKGGKAYKFRCDSIAYFTDSPFTLTEFNINEVLFRDWLEGDVLTFAMAEHFPTVGAPTTVVSSYFAGCPTELGSRYFALVDFAKHELLFIPVEAARHWSLLAWGVATEKLYSMDSGRSLLFAHSNIKYEPAIALIETLINRSPLFGAAALTRSPIRLETAVQPNGVDCGFHVVLNAKSLAEHVCEQWWGHRHLGPPVSGVREVNAFRRDLGRRCLQLPLA